MEKLTIKPWQVMQAFENGADIEMSLIGSSKWSNSIDVIWNWHMRNYRIANITADGMRLDELIEKFPDVIKLCSFGYFLTENYNTKEVLSLVINKPKLISQIKLRQDKKLRPWTMEEFEKHKDEWLCNKHVPGKFKILSIHENEIFIGRIGNASYEYLLNNYTREDGSPCGVLE